jgi:hypothetical protein
MSLKSSNAAEALQALGAGDGLGDLGIRLLRACCTAAVATSVVHPYMKIPVTVFFIT